jgi:glycosyltransferase involved in cell wall biosynthesis
MIVVFIHQHFPGQYQHIAAHLAAQARHSVYFITESARNALPGVHKLVYYPNLAHRLNCHSYTAVLDHAVRRGLAVAEVLRGLRDSGVTPDIIVGHSGWGETLHVKDVFPDVPLLSYFEFFYHPRGADVGFDREFAPACEEDGARLRVHNAIGRMSFAASDWGHTASEWQRSLFPVQMQMRISALHEGIDTDLVRPEPASWLRLERRNIVLSRADEVITYIARNLEPYRGFHIFMRALPEILRRRPRAHALIVGGDAVSYGAPPAKGRCYREVFLQELGSRLDLDRVHFLGSVPYTTYLNVLQISAVHVHLTYPFVPSWSLLETMSAGCLVIGSATPPVLEWLRDGENGLVVDFFSMTALCDRVEEALEHRDRMQLLRLAARATAVDKLDLRMQILPRWTKLLEALCERDWPPQQPPVDGLATQLDLR